MQGANKMATISVDKFVEKYQGKSWDFDGAYGYQCVDLFEYYTKEVVGSGWIGTPATNGARDLFEVEQESSSKFYDRLPASAELQKGDVMVYGQPHGRYIVNGVQVFFGHVAMYIGNNQVIEQNARLGVVTSVDPVFKNGLLGILRPKIFTTGAVSQNVAEQTQNKNKHKIVAGDTFWDLENVYNIPHGTLQTLNPELNPRTLQIGSEINITGQAKPISEPAPEYYTICRGNTFWELEEIRGLAHGTLQALNPELDPKLLQIGSQIRIS